MFKGISGILSAVGTFGGTLERIEVHGVTDTPDFTVKAGGHPIPLHATYHAIVDGTNGNTLLERVDASFLKTSLTARGGVVKKPGADGRTVELDVVMEDARLAKAAASPRCARPSNRERRLGGSATEFGWLPASSCLTVTRRGDVTETEHTEEWSIAGVQNQTAVLL